MKKRRSLVVDSIPLLKPKRCECLVTYPAILVLSRSNGRLRKENRVTVLTSVSLEVKFRNVWVHVRTAVFVQTVCVSAIKTLKGLTANTRRRS